MRRFALLLSMLVLGYGNEGAGQDQNADKYGTLSGRIMILPPSEPAIADVNIYRIEEDRQSGEMRMESVKSIRTDTEGNYRTDLRVGSYMIRAEVPGFKIARMWNIYIQPGGEQIVDLGLQVTEADYKPGRAPSFDIAGTITFESGQPVPDATITLFSVDNFNRTFQTRSDSKGQYVIRPFSSGRYIVYAAKGKYASNPVAVPVPAKERCDLMLLFQKPVTIY